MQTLLKMIVTDKPGVLDRIAGVIRRNGWNIHSITAALQEPGLTQINILLRGRGINTQALGMHLAGLDFVKRWEECGAETHDFCELLVFNIPEELYSQDKFPRTRVLETHYGVSRVEFTGHPKEIDALLEAHRGELSDMARTGCAAIKEV